MTEYEFINAITGGKGADDTSYRLPEFVTAFLLAKDIELEVSNIRHTVIRQVLEGSLEGDVSAQFFALPFLVPFGGGSFDHSSSGTDARSRVHRTANGIKIKIPGAQLIAYYTQKIPKFPLGRQ